MMQLLCLQYSKREADMWARGGGYPMGRVPRSGSFQAGEESLLVFSLSIITFAHQFFLRRRMLGGIRPKQFFPKPCSKSLRGFALVTCHGIRFQGTRLEYIESRTRNTIALLFCIIPGQMYILVRAS